MGTGPAAAPAAPIPLDPYAAPAPAPAPTGVYTGVYPHAPGQFAPQAPYGMPGTYPVSPYAGWLPQPFRALRGIAVTLYILLPLSAVFAGLCAAAFLHRADVLRQIADAGELGMTDALRTKAEDSDSLVAAATTFLVLSMIATAVLFIIWMYRARANVDLFGPSKQHLSTGWAIGGWLVPVVSLWFPKLILHDVWRASDLRTAERGGRTPGRLPLLWAWWLLLVASGVLFFASRLSYPLDEDIELSDADRLRTIDILSGVADLVLVLAAVAAIFVVRKITTFQHEREALAFASGLTPGGVPGGMPGMPGMAAGFPTGAPTPWAAYPAQAPTGRYFAPPVPPAPGMPGVPPVPQAPYAVASGPEAPAATPAAAAPAASETLIAPVVPVTPDAPVSSDASVSSDAPASSGTGTPASSDAPDSADATTVLPVDDVPPAAPAKRTPPPRPAAAPTAGMGVPVEAPTVAAPEEQVSLTKPVQAAEDAAAERTGVPAAEGGSEGEAEAASRTENTEDEAESEAEPGAQAPAEPEAEPASSPEAAADGEEPQAEAEPVAEATPTTPPVADSTPDAGDERGETDRVPPVAPTAELPQVPAQAPAPAPADRVQDAPSAAPTDETENSESAKNSEGSEDTVDAAAEPAPSGERRG
ncbi:DUF4328 domain-containing protein [Embleya sp. NPDC127516]|uniref:DUF4328 domain-containing protein n=1 Tax=Embleya sp. NPDC127516 TaxID=3363990 RepID=UPI003811E3BC